MTGCEARAAFPGASVSPQARGSEGAQPPCPGVRVGASHPVLGRCSFCSLQPPAAMAQGDKALSVKAKGSEAAGTAPLHLGEHPFLSSSP